MQITEKTLRDLRALDYIIDNRPYFTVGADGRHLQIAYRILPGTTRGFWLFVKAVWSFSRIAWGELS